MSEPAQAPASPPVGRGEEPTGIAWSDLRTVLSSKPRDYTIGSIPRAIILLALPMILEMLMQSAFAVVDVFFVARLGPEAVAVVGLTDSLLTLIWALALGLSMGATALVARRIGEGDEEMASRSAGQAILLGIILSVPLGLVSVLWAEDLLQLAGASPQLAAYGASFAAITLGGNLTVMLLFLINAVFRGAGDAVIAMRVLWLANLINMILDPLLIFGWGPFPELGLEGAAVATTIGRGIGVLYQVRELSKGRGRIRLSAAMLRPDLPVMRRLLKISYVGVFQYLIATASWLGLIRILALFGDAALAGYTIAIRIIVFSLLPSWGMGNAAATLVGQNLGAGQPERAEKSVWLTAVSNMIFLGLVGVLFMLFSAHLVEIFTSEPAVVQIGAECLRIVSASYLFLALGMITIQAFNGAGDTATPTWINFICYWLIQIPLAYALAVNFELGPRGVFGSMTVSQLAVALIGVLAFRRGGWKKRVV